MGSYVTSILNPHEKLVYVGRATVLPFLPGILGGVLLAPSVWLYPSPIAPGLVSLIGIVLAVTYYFLWRATELGITDRRVIVKTGLIRRKTQELHLDRIEGMDVEQTLNGRMMGYGSILIRGVGTELDPIDFIERPSRFQKAYFAAAETRDSPDSKGSTQTD